MKKALIISNTSGMISDFLKNDIKILKSRGYQISCACNIKYPGHKTIEFFKENNITEFNVDFPIRNLNIIKIIKSFNTLSQILKHNNYDIIHCHSTIASIIGRECAKHKRKKETKVLYTSHGFPFYKGASRIKSKIFFAIEKYYSKFTDAILTVCKEDFENAKRMNCLKVYHLYGVGVDTKKVIHSKVDVTNKRKELGLGVDDKIIMSIGELNTNKNHQIIIKALALVRDLGYKYAICGRELTEKGKKEELEKLALQLNVDIIFLGYRSDIPEICHCIDMGALPSLKEGLGLSGIEMLSAGVPIVASWRQGIKDYVIDGKTGVLCNPNSAESFAEGIRNVDKLINTETTMNNCIKMAKQFDITNTYKTMEGIYNDIL